MHRLNFQNNQIKILLLTDYILPLMLGIIGFFVVVGPRALYPSNIAWLGSDDAAYSFLGWEFFRNTEWLFPIGLNPRYGLELSNSIVYSDSIPIFAIFFKLFATLLPEHFQYFGIWLFVCFVLQAWFGWKIIGLLSNSIAIRLLGAGFFVFSPPMIWRLQVHLTLVGHFLIVAALYLIFRPYQEKRWLSWGILLVSTILIHIYIFVMVALLWLADLAGRTRNNQQTPQKSLNEFVALVLVIAFICWQVGYFTVDKGVVADGFGYLRLNLISIIDSNNWSYILKDLPGGKGDSGDVHFLGLGLILLILLSIPTALSQGTKLKSVLTKNPYLILVFAGLTLFALSNRVGIGPYGFDYSLPNQFLQVANIFRASGRMFWVVYYTIFFATIFLFIHRKSRFTILFLGLALCIQIADTSAGWLKIRKKLMVEPSSEWVIPLKNPFWKYAAIRYKNVKWLLPSYVLPNSKTLAYYAVKHGLSTDIVTLARISKKKLELARSNGMVSLNTGAYDPDTLYVLEDAVVLKAAQNLNSNFDLLARVDGFNVLAPRWKACSDCPSIGAEIEVK